MKSKKGSATPKARKTKTQTKNGAHLYVEAAESKNRNMIAVMIDTGSTRVHRICQMPWIPEALTDIISKQERHGHLLAMDHETAELFVNGGRGDGLNVRMAVIEELAEARTQAPLIVVSDDSVGLVEVLPNGCLGRVLAVWEWPPDNLYVNAPGGSA